MGAIYIAYDELIKKDKSQILKSADDAVYLAKKVNGTSYILN